MTERTMPPGTPPPNIDFATTLHQMADDTQRLEIAIQALSDSMERRNLRLSPEIANTLESLRLSTDRARKQGEALQKQSVSLQHIVKASAMITTSLELEKVLADVMQSVISLSGAERAYLMLSEHDGDKLTVRATHDWEGSADDTDIEFSRTVVNNSFSRNEAILTMNAQDDTRFQSRKSVVGLSLRSVLCVPLALDNRVIGVLYADNRLRSGVFGSDLVQLLTAFGTQAAIAIEKARLHGEEVRRLRLEKELTVAREIQFSLLPKALPTPLGWEFSATYQPARIVGGDFYDFFGIAPLQGVVIADVADKGVGAALFMSVSRTMIRTAALSVASPGEALAQANDLIVQDSSRSNLFLSAFYAVIDTQTGRAIYANAGHNPPFLYRAATGSYEPLRGKGIVLGIFEGIQLIDAGAQIEPGDCVVFYTDGITEAMNTEGVEFGEERLHGAVLSYLAGSAQQILDSILGAISNHVREAEQSDDVTIVVAKRL